MSNVSDLLLPSSFNQPTITTRRRASSEAVKHVQLQRVISDFTTVSSNIKFLKRRRAFCSLITTLCTWNNGPVQRSSAKIMENS